VALIKRKGARSMAAIQPDVLQALNAGWLSSASLVEVLAIDMHVLMQHVFPSLDASLHRQMQQAKSLGVCKRMVFAAHLLTQDMAHEGLVNMLAEHESDTVRGWGAYVLAADKSLDLDEKLQKMRIFADDAHFCVREWAWLALRPHLSQDIEQSIACLSSWVVDPKENIRRFAIESMRPRGVWSKHIAVLKASPSLLRPLFDPVMEDASRYVQDSVANSLNDAAKTQPEWVLSYCAEWQEKSSSKALAYVLRRALRSLRSKQ